MNKQFLRLSCACIAALLILSGCTTHVVRPSGADMSTFGYKVNKSADETRQWQTDHEIAQTLELAPLARFPAAIAVVRVQSAANQSRSNGVSYGSGAYRVVPTPTVETEDHLKTMRSLPSVQGIVRLNRLVLGKNTRTDKDLRAAAARLHADLTLVYTINTEWTVDNDAEPLDAITIGFSKYKNITVTSTATALLLGTHNGYVYATAEVMADQSYKDNAWRNAEQIEEARETLEQEAFDELVADFSASWPQVLKVYATQAQARQ